MNSGCYTNQVSLTTPPCTEGVRWFVLTEALALSTDQVDAYVNRFGKNARPVQPTNGRRVEIIED